MIDRQAELDERMCALVRDYKERAPIQRSKAIRSGDRLMFDPPITVGLGDVIRFDKDDNVIVLQCAGDVERSYWTDCKA